MRAVVQRVASASVHVDGQLISQIGHGLCVLVGICADDTTEDLDYIGKPWSKSCLDLQFSLLCGTPSRLANTKKECQVSQFTLYATFKKGQKPDFHHAMESVRAKALYDQLLQQLRVGFQDEDRVKDGVFGAMMKVMIENDGPVTFELDSRPFEYLPHSSSQRTGGRGE